MLFLALSDVGSLHIEMKDWLCVLSAYMDILPSNNNNIPAACQTQTHRKAAQNLSNLVKRIQHLQHFLVSLTVLFCCNGSLIAISLINVI